MHIFVEGNSDKIFLQALCNYLNIDAQFIVTNGKNNLINYPNIKKYDNILIIFDADDNFQNSLNNIENQVNKIDENISPKIFLFPDNKNTGNLETLLENICVYNDVKNCFIKYKDCINTLSSNNILFKNLNPKSQIFAYLEVFAYKHNHNDLHQINYKDIFDFNHEILIPLIKFLQNNQ